MCFFSGQVELEARAFPSLVTVAGVPLVVLKCISKVERHLDEQGIYRVSGNTGHVQQLVGKCNSNPGTLALDNVSDVHCVTGLLKLYFRELSEPVFTDALYADFITTARAFFFFFFCFSAANYARGQCQ